MKEYIKYLLSRIYKIFNEEFGKILLITILTFTSYGIERYFYGRYGDAPLYVKTLKFLFSFICFFMCGVGIFTILSFFKKSIKNIIVTLILLVSIPLFMVDIFLLYNFNSIINNTNIQILFETNFNESIEFLGTYLNIKSIIGIIVLLFIFIKLFKLKTKVQSKKIIYIISLFALVQIFEVKDNIENTPIVRTILSVRSSIENSKIYKEMANSIVNNVEITKNNSTIENIVIIIGESTTRNHMGIYGYKLNTTPNLKKLEEEGKLYKFTDTISSHVNTVGSLQKVLTFYNSDSNNEWYTYNNIVDVMSKADYKTYWFSNQESFSLGGNIATAIGNRCDFIEFNRRRDANDDFKNSFDGEIVEKSSNKIDGDKNFIVYHLMGTHSSYKNRYPKEFSKFDEKDYKLPIKEKDKKEISEYDNAVLYNDYVVNKIIDLYKDRESVVIYFSDHAEEMFDFRDYRGHAEDKASRYMMEIPFLIYLSDTTKNKYPELGDKIKSSLNRPYMTDDIIHTILDIVGIETKEFDETRSIINDKFNDKRERKYKGKSYDSYWKIIN